MSLTAFNRLRRMQQVEAMKPENIVKEEPKPVEIVEEKPVEIVNVVEEPKETNTRRRRRA